MGRKRKRVDSKNEEQEPAPDDSTITALANARVEQLMNSQDFKDHLGTIIERKLRSDASWNNFDHLEELASLLLQAKKKEIKKGPEKYHHAILEDIEDNSLPSEEIYTRNRMAVISRYFHLCGWAKYADSTISVSLNDSILISSPNVFCENVTASSFIKLEFAGHLAEGSSHKEITWHLKLHHARQDIKCFVHLRHNHCIVVSSLNSNIQNISIESQEIKATLSYCKLSGEQSDIEEIIESFGEGTKVLLLRNQGFIIGGSTLEETVYLSNKVVSMCEQQIILTSMGLHQDFHIITNSVNLEENDCQKNLWFLKFADLLNTLEDSYTYVEDEQNLELPCRILVSGINEEMFSGKYLILPDTNIVIDDLAIIRLLTQNNCRFKGKEPLVCIPWQVIKEIDKLKMKYRVSLKATSAMHFFEKMLNKGDKKLWTQSPTQFIKWKQEWSQSPDDDILTCALVLMELCEHFLLWTNDCGMRVSAQTAGIPLIMTRDIRNILTPPSSVIPQPTIVRLSSFVP